MPALLKTFLYGASVFVIFTTVAVALKLITNKTGDPEAYFGLMTNNDLMIGVVVAVAVTISHERKKRLK